MNQGLPIGNGIQQDMMQEVRNAAQRNAMLAFTLLILAFIFAVVVAIWMYRDAAARGKPGYAAGGIGLLSFFYGPISTTMIAFAWILFRPRVVCRTATTQDSLPRELPADIQAGPTSEEFFRDLNDS